MKLFRFDAEVGQPIELYGSQGLVVTRVVKPSEDPVSAVCMHIAPGGVVGKHQAIIRQLFMVVSGEGWVSSGDEAGRAIKTGQAALWEAGEWHSSGSEAGMTVIVLEGEQLQPEEFLASI